ncbi:hypothetical protein KC345_g4753 [Hortaea werneckii]|nr:hypothetical protein KC345_g4753 [Hortaea werneckii]
MAPSKESELLATVFKELAAKMPEDPYISRALYDHLQDVATEAPGVTFEDLVLPNSAKQYRGPAKWVRPANGSKRHALLFLHGGGYCFGSPNSHRKMAAHFANACNAPALMVDYRMTPEHAYPAALDDCVSAYKYLLDQGFEPQNVVVIGDSCGGGLASTVPLRAMRDGLPRPGLSVALSPWTDVTGKTSKSLETNANNDALSTPATLGMLRGRYLADGAKAEDPLISPIFAGEDEMRKLPPHWISAAGHDVLLDDGIRMAEKLKGAGVEVELKVHEGMQHVFEFLAGTAPEANQSIREIGQWVRKKTGA